MYGATNCTMMALNCFFFKIFLRIRPREPPWSNSEQPNVQQKFQSLEEVRQFKVVMAAIKGNHEGEQTKLVYLQPQIN